MFLLLVGLLDAEGDTLQKEPVFAKLCLLSTCCFSSRIVRETPPAFSRQGTEGHGCDFGKRSL